MTLENKKLIIGFGVVFVAAIGVFSLVQVGKKFGIIPDSFLTRSQPQVLGERDEFEDHSAVQDFDNDGLTNLVEARAGTDPNKADTDNDGYTDKQEIETQNNPLIAASKSPQDQGKDDFSKDTDKDGLTDAQEKIYKTDVNKADTDGDGFSDKQEITTGHNPLK